MYGVFDDAIRGRIILLNGTEAKKTSKDKPGQDLALARLKLLKAEKGKTDEFYFERKSAGESASEQRIKDANGLVKPRQGNRLPDTSHKKR
jgi:hypothetical protein